MNLFTSFIGYCNTPYWVAHSVMSSTVFEDNFKPVYKKHPSKWKSSNFHSLKSFCARKRCCFCYLVFVYFCFVSWFFLVSVFLRSKFFRKKKINWLETVLITSNTILLKWKCTPSLSTHHKFHLLKLAHPCIFY